MQSYLLYLGFWLPCNFWWWTWSWEPLWPVEEQCQGPWIALAKRFCWGHITHWASEPNPLQTSTWPVSLERLFKKTFGFLFVPVCSKSSCGDAKTLASYHICAHESSWKGSHGRATGQPWALIGRNSQIHFAYIPLTLPYQNMPT